MKRAPNGYRIIKWEDGLYHLYGPDAGCIDEFVSKEKAISCAIEHRDNAHQKMLHEILADMKMDLTK